MLQILILALVSTSAAFPTHRYDVYESYANHHPIVPFKGDVYAFANSNVRRPVQIYEQPRRYDGFVKLSENVPNQAPVYNSDDLHRRVDTQYRYQYPYQRSNGQGTWDGVAATKPTRLYNRFEQWNYDQRYQHVSTTSSPVMQKSVQQVLETTKYDSKLNKTHENDNVTEISTQLNNVNRSLVISEQQITWNNDQRQQEHSTYGNANKTIRSISSHNNTNSLHLQENKDTKINRNGSINNSAKFNTNSTSKTTTDMNSRTNNETNKYNVNTNDYKQVESQPNNTVINVNYTRNVNDINFYGKKTTEDNEVTPRTEKKEEQEDRWIWSNGDEQVETTTLFDLDDRAAFTGNGCPDGKIKVGNSCVTPD